MANPLTFMKSCSFDALHPGSEGLGTQVIRQFSEFGSGWQGALVDKFASSDMGLMAYNELKDYQHRKREGARDSVSSIMQRKATNMYGGGVYGRGKYPGMPDTGMAASSREQHSDFKKDFASRFDALRGLVRAGETFDDMLKSKGFKKAIAEAKEGDILGEGMFGTTRKMEAEFRGQKFAFARKTGDIGEHEVAAMRGAQETVAPTVYSSGKGVIDMELFTGKSLAELEPAEVGVWNKKVAEAFKEAHKGGYEHADPHLGNIFLVDGAKGSKEIALIDFGNAKKLSNYQTTDMAQAAQRKDIEIAQDFVKARAAKKSQLEAVDPFAGGGDPFAQQNVPLSEVMQNLPGQGPSADPFAQQHVSLADVMKNLPEEGIHPGSDISKGANAIKKHSDFGSGWRGLQPEAVAKQLVKVETPPPMVAKTPKISMPKNPPEKELERIVRRNKKFRERSTQSVGIGLRASHRAGKGHCSFGSTKSM